MSSKNNRNGIGMFFTTQFLGAFNDNAFKLFVSLFVINYFVNEKGNTLYVALAGALFVLPFLLFSMYAGYVADRFSKKKVIVYSKAAELLIMISGLVVLWQKNIIGIFGVLFLMGMQSAFFSPAKYGIMPELLENDDLSEGNGQLQMWTYAAIILGTAFGGFLYQLFSSDVYKAAIFFVGISIVGLVSSLYIPKVKASGSKREFKWNFIKEIYNNVREIKKDESIFLTMLGLVYFSFLGGLFQLNILLYAKKVMLLSEVQTSILLTTIALGLGLGSVLAGQLSGKKVEFGLVPLGSIGISLFSLILGSAHKSYFNVLMNTFMLGFSSGFYIVPLNAYIQQRSPVQKRGQFLATNNALGFFAVLISSFALFVLRDIISLSASQIFLLVGLITIASTYYICTLLPNALLRLVFWILAHTIYKIKIIGKDNIPQKGGTLIVPNHVSYIDWLLIMSATQRPIRFVINKFSYNQKIFHKILKISGCIPILGTDSRREIIKALETVKDALRNGELVCIFPEGALTRTGNMLEFKRGVEKIMKDVDCPIVPVHLDNVWGSIFSYERGKYLFKRPKRIPYPVTVNIGEHMASNTTVYEIRNRVMELGADSFKYRMKMNKTLPVLFFDKARKNLKEKCIVDSTGKDLSYKQTLVGSVVLNKLVSKKFKEQNIGVLLPPSCGAVLVNLGLAFSKKTAVNINYTSSQEAIESLASQCDMRNVITSRKFMEKINLQIPCRVVFIEDLVCEINLLTKAISYFQSCLLPRKLSKRMIFGNNKANINDVATMIFTSGSTGIPKGVMLTHANIRSNIEGLSQIFPTDANDSMMGILPFFHSFGYTGTFWYPLIKGIRTVYHVNPLDAKIIGKLIDKYKATILMATPTFLSNYTSRCIKEQFKSLRLVVVGAEKLKEQVANSFKDKFGLMPMEGYGCTELSPIVALNLDDFKSNGIHQKSCLSGTIGKPLPGIAVRIVDQETGKILGPNQSGLLYVKGPNVMKGYLKNQELTKEVVNDGWYKTGDIAQLSEDGFIRITDRLSRFSKIGGEMVPHIKVEEAIQEVVNDPEKVCVVTSVPDESKGEKLAVLCNDWINIKKIINSLMQKGLPRLWIPSESMFFKVDNIPLLGTGKLDLNNIKKLAKDLVFKNVVLA